MGDEIKNFVIEKSHGNLWNPNYKEIQILSKMHGLAYILPTILGHLSGTLNHIMKDRKKLSQLKLDIIDEFEKLRNKN